jgi:uncharacterized hydrophobic protein (TIGR00271 family)
MLQLRVFGAAPSIAEVADRLDALPGSRHVLSTEDSRSGNAVVTADIRSDAADGALEALHRLGVAAEDIELLRLESIAADGARRPMAGVVWADLLDQAGANARPLARYLVLMAVAGVIAGFGVIYANGILVVGAMAISPDMLPITATCTALVLRRHRLALRAGLTLVIGLAAAGVVAAAMTAVLDAVNALPTGFALGAGGLQGLETVNVSTPVVAFVAGIAGILALETRASASIGVAISVTTIPASAYFGVAAGVGEGSKARGALLVLAINVGMLIVGGCTTLLVQRRLAVRPGSSRSRESRDRASTQR